MLATAGALKQAETLRQNAALARAKLNSELSGVAETLNNLTLLFPARAGETGKLYGSITTAQIAARIKADAGLEIDRRHVGHQPLRELGEYSVPVRLTADLVPKVKVIIHREGQAYRPEAEIKAEAEAAALAEVEAAPAEETPAADSETAADETAA